MNKLYKISHKKHLGYDYYDSIIFAESDQLTALRRSFEYFKDKHEEWPSIDHIDKMSIEYIGDTHLWGFIHGSFIPGE